VNDRAGKHQRTSDFLLAGWERRVLPRLAAALPNWVMPDHMTVLGLLASTALAASYLLSNRDPRWLWAGNLALIVNWYGDSLDGNLARYRKIERPRYGYYLDHLSDAYSTLAVGIGLGLSPFMLLSVGLSISIIYLVMSINVYLETHAFGEFSFGYGKLGPTEARIILILLNTMVLIGKPLPFTLLGIGATVFDVAGLLAVTGMFGLLIARVTKNLRKLAQLEPPGVKRNPANLPE
jgi:archaetidylinositol phosphate synthase